MIERRPVSRTLVQAQPLRPVTSVFATSVILAVALAGCTSVSSGTSGGGKSVTTAAIDPKLGVAPSPRVVAAGEAVPKGGGRAMVGKPYTVAGKRYVPKHDPNLEQVGFASWYGNAFHGRRTANGEIFDSEHLSAAHPTMPLPSYARITSMNTGRSVVVRVNDRGPFHSNRIVDISRRTADLIGVRAAGIAKVKVEYVGPAPTEGDDSRFLLASYRGPADVPASMPETMVASADQLPGVTSPATNPLAGLFGRRAAPAPQPAAPAAAPVQVAAVDENTPVGPMVSGSVLPPVRPAVVEEAYVVVASIDPADVYLTGTVVASVPKSDANVTSTGFVPASFIVGPQPIVDGDDPEPPPAPPMRHSYAADRVDLAYSAVDDLGEGVSLGELVRRLEGLSSETEGHRPATAPAVAGAATASGAVLQVGLFANPANADRLAGVLAGIGVVSLDEINVNGRALKRVRLSALAVTPAEALAAAERAGATGARFIR